MVRLVGRSRGCKACLRRRIKCDEKLPECTQCVTRGNRCPGATVGPVFVSMEPKPGKKARAKRKPESRSQGEPGTLPEDTRDDFSGDSSRANTPAPPGGEALTRSSLSMEFLLPSSYQPSKAAPFGHLFLDHFISAFDSQRIMNSPVGTWYDYLPAIYHTSPYESCQDATRATMMVYYGVMTNDMSIQTEAYKWYAKALESQRKYVQKDTAALSKSVPAAEEIISPMILAVFELVSSTTPTGWLNHVMGAATMLQMRRPEGCRTGLAHLVFRTTRPVVMYMTMTTEEQHPFATPPWDTVPFEVYPKMTYDRLLDILFLIPRCLSLDSRIKKIRGADIIEEKKLRLELVSICATLLRRLQGWWQGGYVQEQAALGRDANSFGDPDPLSTSPDPYFPNAFAAASTASYHAGNIVLYTFLTLYDGETYMCQPEVEWHSRRILASCSYMIRNQVPSSGTIMMVYPLKIMWRCCRNPLYTHAAFEILENWGAKKGILGICTQAAPRFEIPIISPSTMGNLIPENFDGK